MASKKPVKPIIATRPSTLVNSIVAYTIKTNEFCDYEGPSVTEKIFLPIFREQDVTYVKNIRSYINEGDDGRYADIATITNAEEIKINMGKDSIYKYALPNSWLRHKVKDEATLTITTKWARDQSIKLYDASRNLAAEIICHGTFGADGMDVNKNKTVDCYTTDTVYKIENKNRRWKENFLCIPSTTGTQTPVEALYADKEDVLNNEILGEIGKYKSIFKQFIITNKNVTDVTVDETDGNFSEIDLRCLRTPIFVNTPAESKIILYTPNNVRTAEITYLGEFSMGKPVVKK